MQQYIVNLIHYLFSYAPSKSHEKWVEKTWKRVLYELDFIPHDFKILSVKTRPETNDFARQFNILEWPTIEVYD